MQNPGFQYASSEYRKEVYTKKLYYLSILKYLQSYKRYV